jgi:sorbitol-specific phosphotransferase system component IIBC
MLAKKILRLDRKLQGKYVVKGTVITFSDAPVGTFVEYPQEIISLEEIEKFLESFNLAKVVKDKEAVSSQSNEQTFLTEQKTEDSVNNSSEIEENKEEKTKQTKIAEIEKDSESESSNTGNKRTRKRKNN